MILINSKKEGIKLIFTTIFLTGEFEHPVDKSQTIFSLNL